MDIPLIGFGTYNKNPNKAYSMVLKALQCGYRYIDTATIYCNERQVGKAITDFLSNDPALDRKQLFITTKLPMNGMRKNKVEYFLRRSLSFLNLDYVDLYLIHAPFAVKYHSDEIFWPINEETGQLDVDLVDFVDTWKEMERLIKVGLVRKIGVSNFNEKQLQRLISCARIRPFANQIECHLRFQNRALIDFCEQNEIRPIAFAPLGSPGRSNSVTTELIQTQILQKELTLASDKLTAAQAMLAFLMNQNIVVIPGAETKEQLEENWNSNHIRFDSMQMTQLKQMNLDQRTFYFDSVASVRSHPEYPFEF